MSVRRFVSGMVVSFVLGFVFVSAIGYALDNQPVQQTQEEYLYTVENY